MDFTQIETALKAVYAYYPIGASYFHKEYSGWSNARKIVDRKIRTLDEPRNNSWLSLIDNLKELYPNKVFDMGYLQFPSYTCCVSISENETDQIKYTRNLIVSISLLCPFYTYYYEDRYVFKIKSSFNSPAITRILFLSANTAGAKLDEAAIDIIRRNIEVHFKGHEYILHKYLFDYKVDYADVDDGRGEIKPTPLNNFLFDAFSYDENGLSVLE